jgi:hypothetical protein
VSCTNNVVFYYFAHEETSSLLNSLQTYHRISRILILSATIGHYLG